MAKGKSGFWASIPVPVLLAYVRENAGHLSERGPFAGIPWADRPIFINRAERQALLKAQSMSGVRKADNGSEVMKAMAEIENMTQAYLDRAERYKEAYPEGFTGEL